jgi:TonB family protein
MRGARGMFREAMAVALAAAACMLAPAAAAQPGIDPQPPGGETQAGAARRELLRTFAEAVVERVRARLREGVEYPPEALANRWEGTVWIAILYPSTDERERISVQRGSGYAVLDRAAQEIVQTVVLPVRPTPLLGAEFDVTFPIQFRLVTKRIE